MWTVDISLIIAEGVVCTPVSIMMHVIKALFVGSGRKLDFPKEKQLAPEVANRLLLN